MEVVGVDDRDLHAERSGELRRDAIRIGRPEHDRALVRRQRPGVPVDGGDRLAEDLVEDAALPAQAAEEMRDRGPDDAAPPDLVDHQLHRLRLADRRERPGAAREREREPRRTDELGGDEARLRDRHRRLGDDDDVAGARDPAHGLGDERSEVVARRDHARAHRDRDEPVGEPCFAHRQRDHTNTSAPSAAAISSIL